MPVHRITNTIVEQMPSGKRDVFIWDADLKGFGAKITPAGKRVYLIKYRMPGSHLEGMISLKGVLARKVVA